MKADEIVSAVVDILRNEVTSLRSVASHIGSAGPDIERAIPRLPAVYVTYNGSHYNVACQNTMVVEAEVGVFLVTKPNSHRAEDTVGLSLLEEVRGTLSGRQLGPGMEGLRPVSTSLVLRKESHLVHSLTFDTAFESSIEKALDGREAIRTAHMNILEQSIVTLLQGTEDTDHPLYRLHDRNLSRPFMPTDAETLVVLVDQGPEVPPKGVDTLIIPSGHNLDGTMLELRRSDDGIDYVEATEGWVAAKGTVHRTWAEVESRYWQLIVNSPSLTPSIPEVFLTRGYEWERMPLPSSYVSAEDNNIVNRSTSDGRQRFLKSGPGRRNRVYNVSHCNQSMKEEMLSLWETWGEGRPFWLCDHEGQWIYGGLKGSPGLLENVTGSFSLAFDFMEVLS